MHKTHIFDQKNNAKKIKDYWPTYPIFFRTVTGNKQFLFLGLIIDPADMFSAFTETIVFGEINKIGPIQTDVAWVWFTLWNLLLCHRGIQLLALLNNRIYDILISVLQQCLTWVISFTCHKHPKISSGSLVIGSHNNVHAENIKTKTEL